MKILRAISILLVLAVVAPLQAADVLKGIVVDAQDEPLIGVTVQ